MNKTVLITGANRGIGQALSRQFLANGDTLVAAVRDKSAPSLLELYKAYPSQLHILEVELDKQSSVEACASEFLGKFSKLDILVNMAGVLARPHDRPLKDVDLEQCRESFEINVLSPLNLTRCLLPALLPSPGSKVINISSGCGTISEKRDGWFYAYGTSKAALNMVSRTIANEHRDAGLICISLDPGWVRTDLGGPEADLAPEESAAELFKTIENLSIEKSGQFLHYSGKELAY